jgi:cytochrome c551/c552
MKKSFPFVLAALAFSLPALSSLADITPIKDVLAQIDPATGKAKGNTKEFTVSGIVAARVVLPGDKVLAFVHVAGEPALAVLADAKDAAPFQPRNLITAAGNLGEGPFGAALVVKSGSGAVTETNKPFTSAPVAAAVFKDASALAGRYVQLTNVTFAPGKFDASGHAKVKAADGSEVTLALGKGAANRDVPNEPADVFGVIVKSGGEWQLGAARFLPVNRKQCQEVATMRTCLGCHNPDMQVVGPAYRDVAAKYRNDPEALNKMILQMENGGTGKWGTNVMIALKTIVPPDDMKLLANWIYSYRWDAVLAE